MRVLLVILFFLFIGNSVIYLLVSITQWDFDVVDWDFFSRNLLAVSFMIYSSITSYILCRYFADLYEVERRAKRIKKIRNRNRNK